MPKRMILTKGAFFLAEIPENEYIKYFAPDYSLKIPRGNIILVIGFLFRLFSFNRV